MAEHMARLAFKDRFLFSSAGIAAHPDFPIPAMVSKLLTEEGVKQFKHTPRVVAAKDVEEADAIFVMEKHHQQVLLERFPKSAEKIIMLKNYSDIGDPIGGSEEVYRNCLKEIKEALKAALERL